MLEVLLYALPAYIANGAPTVFGGKIPIDLNKKINGEPIFGKNKTWKGFAAGVIGGSLTGCIVFNDVIYGTLLGFLAMIGDLIGSFLKRRLKIKPGKTFFPLDQTDFMLTSLIGINLKYKLTISAVILLLVFTIAIHLLASAIGIKLKLKSSL